MGGEACHAGGIEESRKQMLGGNAGTCWGHAELFFNKRGEEKYLFFSAFSLPFFLREVVNSTVGAKKADATR